MKTNRTKKNSLLMAVTTGGVAVFLAVGCASHHNEAHQNSAGAAPGTAQTTGVPGSLSGTPTIRETVKESKPWWPLVWTWRDEPRAKATKATNE